jgi:hypothetical protein
LLHDLAKRLLDEQRGKPDVPAPSQGGTPKARNP